MTHIEFLVEEPSAKAALQRILPSILEPDHSFGISAFEGKRDLLQKLPSRLQGYSKWIPENWWIVVLVDRDHDDCHQLKNLIENEALAAGLHTKSQPHYTGSFDVITRIVVEELEAWFFGDVEALRAAYPGVSDSLHLQERYRDPDAIPGGAAESLERILQTAGYHEGGLEKIRAAKEIAVHMAPERNKSKSFQIFRDALIAL